MTPERKAAILRERLDALDIKAAQIARMTSYLRAKIAWIEAGERGAEPLLSGDGVVAPAAWPADIASTAVSLRAGRLRQTRR